MVQSPPKTTLTHPPPPFPANPRMPGSRRRRRSPSSSTHISTVSLFCGLLLLHAAVTVAFITGSLPIHPTARPRPHHRCKATTMSSHPPPQEHVLATHHANRVLELTLNRPKALNALSSQMLHVLTSHVKRALEDDGVAAVLLTAAEGSRAFSAGGDIKEILAARLSEKEAVPQGCDPKTYITVEYELDSLLHKLSQHKPVVAVCDGIAMGGGAGIFQGARHRVVTPGSTFAMPECRIAILPDAGAMGFLFRAPGQVPLYLALTGARLSGHCMKSVGLATHVVDPTDVPALVAALRAEPVARIPALLAAKAISSPAEATPIQARRAAIDAAFGHATVPEIHRALRTAVDHAASPGADTEWLTAAINALESECPVSHVVTLHAMRTAQRKGLDTWDVDQGLAVEYVANCCLGVRPDFVEGVSTAVGARKGETPTWTHESWAVAARDPAIVALLADMERAGSIWEHLNSTG